VSSAAPTTVLGQQRLGNSPAEPSAGGDQGALATPSSMTRCQSRGRHMPPFTTGGATLEHGCDHPESGSTQADLASEVHANRMGWPRVVAVTAPPLLLAGLAST
jgi:hypothetical protein